MKQYNGEKAIISLTSWKARINTVDKTLFSLIQQCPGFHIVLVLSEEEFPMKEKELPENLLLFVENDLIEILWVYKNYKAFKKVLFTMDKYRDVPVISADDDFVYEFNYAEKLFSLYTKYKTLICFTASYKLNKVWPHGYAVLYPPSSLLFFKNFQKILDILLNNKINHDDGLLGRLYYLNPKNKMAKSLNKSWHNICFEHTKTTELNALSKNNTKERFLYEEKFIQKILEIFKEE